MAITAIGRSFHAGPNIVTPPVAAWRVFGRSLLSRRLIAIPLTASADCQCQLPVLAASVDCLTAATPIEKNAQVRVMSLETAQHRVPLVARVANLARDTAIVHIAGRDMGVQDASAGQRQWHARSTLKYVVVSRPPSSSCSLLAI